MTTQTAAVDRTPELAEKLIDFLERGIPAEGLFAPDLFLDFTMPLWRVQAGTAEGAVAARRAGHPNPGRVPRSRFDRTERGFVVEVEEEWEQDGENWYCRELFRADVRDGSIVELAVYCTGDWDAARVAEHRAAVQLIRP
jgi:hypothetical protein